MYHRISPPLSSDLDGYLNSTSLYQLNSRTVVKEGLINSDIVLVTAHPDDESMFFTPTILELTKHDYNNEFHLLCFSNGNYDGLGETRQREIHTAARYLDISSVKVLGFEDNITKLWETDDVAQTLTVELDEMQLFKPNLVLLTFDQNGVSDHPNHRSLYYGVQKYANDTVAQGGTGPIVLSLKSWPLIEKYSSFIWVNMQLLWKYIQETKLPTLINQKVPDLFPLQTESDSFTIYSDFNAWFVSLATMSYAHYSQIVWYRWIWIFLSKYMNSNELIRVSA